MEGWLKKYEKGGEVNANEEYVSIPPNFVGSGYDITPRRYSPAWGGQFEDGGELSPQEKLQEYRRSQSKIGADAVRKGREKFAKDYIEPIIKTGATAFGLASGNPLTLNTLFAPRTLAMLAGNTTLGYYMNKENDPYLEAATSVTGNIVKPQLNEQLKRIGGINDFLQAKEEFSKGNIGKGIFNTATGIGGVYDSDRIPGRYDDYIDKALELLNVTGDLNDS